MKEIDKRYAETEVELISRAMERGRKDISEAALRATELTKRVPNFDKICQDVNLAHAKLLDALISTDQFPFEHFETRETEQMNQTSVPEVTTTDQSNNRDKIDFVLFHEIYQHIKSNPNDDFWTPNVKIRIGGRNWQDAKNMITEMKENPSKEFTNTRLNYWLVIANCYRRHIAMIP